MKERCALVERTPTKRAFVESSRLARSQLSTLNYQLLLLIAAIATAFQSAKAQEKIPLVSIQSVDPSIVVELRYASAKNLAGRPLYQPGTPAMVRPEVAQRLAIAQRILRHYQYSLKIWDAYRPQSVQMELWKAASKNDYVANPNAGAGSLHKWGVAVDATLTDFYNRPVSMPTDYDNFTPAAMWKYRGTDPAIRGHLYLLQASMRDAGFLGLRTEWWHFTVEGWQKFLPPEEAKRAMEVFGTKWEGQL